MKSCRRPAQFDHFQIVVERAAARTLRPYLGAGSARLQAQPKGAPPATWTGVCRALEPDLHLICTPVMLSPHLLDLLRICCVLHTWGSALTHHPHVHMIVPGGGISPDGQRWISCRPGFFLPVRALSRLFRWLFLKALSAAHAASRLSFFGDHAALADAQSFAAYLAPLRKTEWVVYSKHPFGGPEAVLAYLSRYTHRVAIANSRLIAFDKQGVTFKWKDYRIETRDRYKCMTLTIDARGSRGGRIAQRRTCAPRCEGA
jgi:putative transposase